MVPSSLLAVGNVQVIGLSVAQLGQDVVIAVTKFLERPLLTVVAVFGVLLYVCPSLSAGVGDLQHQTAVAVLELVYLCGVQLYAGVSDFFQVPVLAGIAVVRILLYICAACRAGVSDFHTAFQLRCPGIDGVRTVTVFSEQELLCLFPAALCPECGIWCHWSALPPEMSMR